MVAKAAVGSTCDLMLLSLEGLCRRDMTSVLGRYLHNNTGSEKMERGADDEGRDCSNGGSLMEAYSVRRQPI